MSKKVFLWYPRRVWKVEGDKHVNTFSWLTWATDYSGSWRSKLPRWAQTYLHLAFPPGRQKFTPPTPYDPKAKENFETRWPTPEDFIRDQRPICRNAKEKYFYLLLLTTIRRVIPNLIATELVGVQPMTGPVGNIFTMRYNYGATTPTTETENA